MIAYARRRLAALVALMALGAAPAIGQAAPPSDPAAADTDAPAHERHVALVFPTRYLDPYFNEIGFGYRRETASALSWGINGGLVHRRDERYAGRAPVIWGGALGLEGRYRVAGRPGNALSLAAAAHFSRAYFRAMAGAEATETPGVSRLVEAPVVARRNELQLLVTYHNESVTGFVVDLSAGVGVGRLGYRVGGGVDAAPTALTPPERPLPGGQDLRADEVYELAWPRLRVGLGWAW